MAVTDKSLLAQVADVIVEQLGVAPAEVTRNATFAEDLGADSLDVIELVMALEERFGIEIPDADVAPLHTVGHLVVYLERRTGAAR